MSKQLALLITYHNEDPLLHDCLELLLSAEDIPDEILIYDDASDNPAKDHMIPHPNLYLIRGTENRGPSFARNELLHRSTCDYDQNMICAYVLQAMGHCEMKRKRWRYS